MIDGQQTIFDIMYPKYKITKPIRLIELFAGYGSQYLALKYLGANVKHYKICEWATKSIQAYNDLHIQDYSDYSSDLSDDEILEHLTEGEGRGFLGRSMYDAIFDKIHALKTENEQLKDNWNKLKEWVNKQYDYYMNNKDYIGGRLCFTDMKDKMQELEQGSDSNE